MRNIFRLIRWPNLLIMILIMVLVRYFLIAIPLGHAGVELPQSNIHFMLLVLAMVLLAAAGYVINDYFDMDVDGFNKPDRQIAGKLISAESVKRMYWVLNATGIAVAFFLSYSTQSIRLALILVMVAGLLYFYSSRYKRMVLVGNLVVSFVAATGVFVVWFFELTALMDDQYAFVDATRAMPIITGFVFAYALFGFLSTFIREVVKDIEDHAGDERCGCRTFAVVYGTNLSRNLAIGLMIMLISMIGFWQYILYYRNLHLAMQMLLLSDALGVIIVIRLYFASTVKHFQQASVMIKILMLSGIITIPFLYF
jgi:4-hydroxybenzoate polyprenyltransferase